MAPSTSPRGLEILTESCWLGSNAKYQNSQEKGVVDHELASPPVTFALKSLRSTIAFGFPRAVLLATPHSRTSACPGAIPLRKHRE